MSEEEVKSLRFSFTNPYQEGMPKHRVNQFGHTILSENEDFKPAEMNIEVDDNGEISANPKMSIIDSEQFTRLVDSHLKQNDLKTQEYDSEPAQPMESGLLSKLIAELDDLKEDKSKPFIPGPDGWVTVDNNKKVNWNFKSCLNKDCMYNLAKDAKFCSKCGTYQMPKFCTECGYSYNGMEKFCPDCGTKR